MEGIESQTFDDQGTKVTDAFSGKDCVSILLIVLLCMSMLTSVRNVRYKTKQSKKPCLVVQVSLPDLIPINTFLLDTSLIATYACDHNQFLLTRKPSESRRRIGKKQAKDDCPC